MAPPLQLILQKFFDLSKKKFITEIVYIVNEILTFEANFTKLEDDIGQMSEPKLSTQKHKMKPY